MAAVNGKPNMAQIDPQALPPPATGHPSDHLSGHLSGQQPGQLPSRARLPSRLSAEVWLYHHGWALPISALLALMAVAWFVVQVAPAQARVTQLKSELQVLQSHPKPAPPMAMAAPPQPGQPLRDLLSKAGSNPTQVRQIASLASLHGISLPRAQYATSRQTPSGIEHTDITFNFVAAYPPARAFIEAALLDLPNASVDRVSFERDHAQGTEAEVSLRLTLWRWPTGYTPEATR